MNRRHNVDQWRRGDRIGHRSDDESRTDAQLPGVIDTLGFGFAALFVRPLVMLPLVLLDLYLLFGPRVLLAPLATAVAEATSERGGVWETLGRNVGQLETFNVAELLVLGAPPTNMPAIVPALPEEQIGSIGSGVVIANLPVWSTVIVAVIVIGLAFVFASGFRILLAASGAGVGRMLDSIRPRIVGTLSLASVGWLLLMAGLALLVAMPILVAATIAAMVGFRGIGLVWIVLVVPVAWAFVHFYFAIPALFVDRSGPLRAVKSSYRVVRRYFWQSVRFIAVSLIITTGLTYALQELAINTPGVLLAIVINAFLASGMIIAAMLFYRDRARHLGLPGNVLER